MPRNGYRFSLSRLTPLLVVTVLPLLVAGLTGPRVSGHETGAGLKPILTAPLDGEVVVETALRFSFAPPPGLTRHTLLLSEQPFSTEGMDAAPPAAGLTQRPLPARGASWEALRLPALDRETRFYWAVASTDPASGFTRVSPARSFTLLPAFRVAAPASPLIRQVTTGRLPGGSGASGKAPVSRRLRLGAGFEFDTRSGEPPLAAAQSEGEPAAAGEREAAIVQFDHAPSESDRAALEAAGAAPVAYLPDNAFLVRLAPGARAAVARQAGVVWSGPWRPAYRLSPRLAGRSPGQDTLVVLLFPDQPMSPVVARMRGLGASVIATSDNDVNRIVHLRYPPGRALDVARLPGVAWVEPYVRPVAGNDNAQWVVQTNVSGNRRIWDMGIDGTGQIVNTTDSGITTAHNQFRDGAVSITNFGDFPTHRKIIAYKRGSNSSSIAFGDHLGASYHGTHTAGTICGNDAPNGTSPRDGMARGAKLYFEDLSGPDLANGIDHFPDLNDLYILPYLGNAGGAARISSNSWGANVGGAYDVSCMQVDQFSWAHKDFLICFSNGNAGSANTVGSPAGAKDILSVGGTQNGTSANLIYASTSRGPTDDGRIKPTVCSPGQTVSSAYGGGTSTYQALSGTSMASPTTAGEATLIRQYLTDGWYPTGTKIPANGFTPSAALLKALVINSADNGVSGYNAPDNNVGWGRVMADNVCYFAGDAKKLIAIDNTPGLGQGDYIEYQIQVVSSSVPLEVALCWTDYPGNPAAAVQRVNNLNLTVSRGATVYKGNVYTGGWSVTGGAYDSLNVEETVLVNAPAAGLWTVRVEAPAVPFGPQPFGLAVTGDIDAGAGTLYLDRAEYGSTSRIRIRVVDTNAGSPVSVHITSTTEPAGETVSLSGSNGVLTGSLVLSPYAPGLAPLAPGLRPLGMDLADDTLRVSHGDLLTATYVDASPPATLTAQAHVAIETPRITAVTAAARGSGAARITWTTDLNATSRVYYGLTTGLELGSVLDSTATLQHDVLISGLVMGETYYYDVESVGLNGNPTRDDNGGQHYRVTVSPPGHVLLVIGDATFDRLEAYEEAFLAAGWSYDLWTGSLADNAALGDTTAGLRAYRAVIWQPGFDQYPPFSDAQRATVANYLNGGGRLAVISHDVAWAFGDATSPVYTAARMAWLRDVLHTTWQADPATITQITGYAGDPISGPYTGGVSYTPIRSGGAGDQVDSYAGAGTASYAWRDNNAPADDIGLRWLSSAANGSPDSAVWGGQPSRLAAFYLEWTAINPPFTTPSTTRTDILDRTLIWLIGRDRPDVAVGYPAGGEVITADSIDVAWSETAYGGTSVSHRAIECSLDGGASWTLVAQGLGPSPYRWDLSALPNCLNLRVRVRVTDSGQPHLSGSGASVSDVSLQRAAGDAAGPVVVAGSIAAAPNPFVQAAGAQISARVTDVSRGGQNVTAAEWSRGAAPAPAGTGAPMTGTFGSPTEYVQAAVPTKPIPAGLQTFWIRGRDQAGNWGPAASLQVVVNPGSFALAATLCPADTSVIRGDTLGLVVRLVNTGTAGDTLRYRVRDLGPGPHVTVLGAPLTGSLFVAQGDTAALPVIPVEATAAAGLTELTTVEVTGWPASDPADADTCRTLVEVVAPVASVACPADTIVPEASVIPLTFVVSNTGTHPDTLRWWLADLGPGPDVRLTGGNQSGAVHLDPAGVWQFQIPGVSVTADAGAPDGQTTRVRLVSHPDLEPSRADTCTTLVRVARTSGVASGAGQGTSFAVAPSRPNPFREITRLHFSLDRTERATVRVYTLDGRLLRTLLDAALDPGAHEVAWDGRDASGSELPSGLYFYRLVTASGRSASGRMLRIH